MFAQNKLVLELESIERLVTVCNVVLDPQEYVSSSSRGGRLLMFHLVLMQRTVRCWAALCLSECLNWQPGRGADEALFCLFALSVCRCLHVCVGWCTNTHLYVRQVFLLTKYSEPALLIKV